MAMQHMANYRSSRVTKARMPVRRRHTNTTERLRRILHGWCARCNKCVQAMAKTAAKQNGPRVPILDKETKRMKLNKDIIITCKLRIDNKLRVAEGTRRTLERCSLRKLCARREA